MRHRQFLIRLLLKSILLPLAALSAATVQQTAQPTLLIRSADPGQVHDMAVSPDGKWYVTLCQLCQQTGTVTIWSAKDGFEYRTFSVGQGGISAPAISVANDSRTIATAFGNEVRLFDVNTAALTRAFRMTNSPIGASIVRLSFHPKRLLLAVLDAEGTGRIRDLIANTDVFQKAVDRDTSILRFSPDGSLLATGSPNAAHIWAWEQDKELAAFHAHSMHSANLSRILKSMVFTPSGAAFQDQTAEQLGLYQFNDLVFGVGTPKLALVHKDEINIVELPAGTPIERIPIESGEIKTCIFTAPSSRPRRSTSAYSQRRFCSSPRTRA